MSISIAPSGSKIRSVNPRRLSTPKIRCNRGRRRSLSTSNVRLPDIAIVAPILTVVAVLPSRGPAEVIIIERNGLSLAMNSKLVRMVRTHSAAVEFGFDST